MDSIYGMLPINRAAGLVTGQSGCTTELTKEQMRENLVKRKQVMEAELLSLPKKSDRRKELGQELQKINTEINAIRPKRRSVGVENYFIDIARENLSSFEFNRWMNIAADRLRADKENARS